MQVQCLIASERNEKLIEALREARAMLWSAVILNWKNWLKRKMQTSKTLEQNRKPVLCLLHALLIAILATGCIPLGPRVGKERVMAKRTELNKGSSEQIVGVPTEHHWALLVTPEGPELNYVLSVTWRFYLTDSNGHREPLPFLKRRDDLYPIAWPLIAPIAHTNLWIAGEQVYKHGQSDFRVICFNAKRIVSDNKLEYPDEGRFSYDSENHVLTYETKNGTRRFDPLANADLHYEPASE